MLRLITARRCTTGCFAMAGERALLTFVNCWSMTGAFSRRSFRSGPRRDGGRDFRGILGAPCITRSCGEARWWSGPGLASPSDGRGTRRWSAGAQVSGVPECRGSAGEKLALSARESVRSGLSHGLTCGAFGPRVTVRDCLSPELMARWIRSVQCRPSAFAVAVSRSRGKGMSSGYQLARVVPNKPICQRPGPLSCAEQPSATCVRCVAGQARSRSSRSQKAGRPGPRRSVLSALDDVVRIGRRGDPVSPRRWTAHFRTCEPSPGTWPARVIWSLPAGSVSSSVFPGGPAAVPEMIAAAIAEGRRARGTLR